MRIISWFVLGLQVCSIASAVGRDPCPELLAREVTTYVLDTNILLTKPNAFLDYAEGQQVAITEQTLRELESKKADLRLGVSAREFFREFKKTTGEGSLSEPITLPNGSTLLILTLDEVTSESPHALRSLDVGPSGNPDNKILGAMLQYRARNPGRNVVFVSNDEAFRVVARVHDFQIGRIEESARSVVILADEEISYTGLSKHSLPEGRLQEMFQMGDATRWKVKIEDPSRFYDNQFVTVVEGDAAAGTAPVVLRYKSADQSLHGLKITPKTYVTNIKPKNLEQRMALELLMDRNVTAVTMFGKPGSGKTLMAMAAAFEQYDKKVYEKILYAKPYKHTGGEDELGFLKGDFDEKTGAWHESFVDNLEPLFGIEKVKSIKAKIGDKPNEILRQFGMEPLKIGYARGRSIAKAIMIIDEAQNLTHIQLKTLLTRVGEGTKIILMGDLGQIDLTSLRNPEASPFFRLVNSETYKESALSGHTLLVEGLRSPTTDMFSAAFDEIEGRVPPSR
ncbi:hypothetical protein EB061_02075 [bacterium]|nr:hypothetical protein [bacterium]